jgi:hypothetical protein
VQTTPRLYPGKLLGVAAIPRSKRSLDVRKARDEIGYAIVLIEAERDLVCLQRQRLEDELERADALRDARDADENLHRVGLIER